MDEMRFFEKKKVPPSVFVYATATTIKYSELHTNTFSLLDIISPVCVCVCGGVSGLI